MGKIGLEAQHSKISAMATLKDKDKNLIKTAQFYTY